MKILSKLRLTVSCLYGFERHDFDAGKSITRALKIESFLDHVRSDCHLGPKKSRFSGSTPSDGPRNGKAQKCHDLQGPRFPMAFEMDGVGGGGGGRYDEYLVFTNYLLRIETERRSEGQ